MHNESFAFCFYKHTKRILQPNFVSMTRLIQFTMKMFSFSLTLSSEKPQHILFLKEEKYKKTFSHFVFYYRIDWYVEMVLYTEYWFCRSIKTNRMIKKKWTKNKQ